ncbi:MAG: phosphatidylserine decarboxylase, partial [Gammaproteobacteria bacterium]|nr:phosphatidylserine decarboxylase [Gammaproteobacteria bacterium]
VLLQKSPPSGHPQRMQFGQPIVLEKGAEMGRFKLGSTVVMCFAKPVDFADFKPEIKVQMGQSLGHIDTPILL